MNNAGLAEIMAGEAHANQFRRDGKTPYINHVKAVVERLKNEDDNTISAAWLHDVLEDTKVTLKDLNDAKLPHTVIAAVCVLTKAKYESYIEYLKRVKDHPVALKIKIADILSNLSDDPTEKQIIKYAEALVLLLRL